MKLSIYYYYDDDDDDGQVTFTILNASFQHNSLALDIISQTLLGTIICSSTNRLSKASPIISGGGPRVVVSTAAFRARVRGSGFGSRSRRFERNKKCFFPIHV